MADNSTSDWTISQLIKYCIDRHISINQTLPDILLQVEPIESETLTVATVEAITGDGDYWNPRECPELIHHVYTDGSQSSNDPEHTGIGVYFGPEHPSNISESYSPPEATHNKAELEAMRRALLVIQTMESTAVQFIIHTDSEYCLNILGATGDKYERQGYRNKKKPVANAPHVKALREVFKTISLTHKIEYLYVKAHVAKYKANEHELGNHESDKLAKAGLWLD